MNVSELNNELKNIDLSLLDQILKGRFIPASSVLDAGFGGGRNSLWFINNGFDVFGIDQQEESVRQFRDLLIQNKIEPSNSISGQLEKMPYSNKQFDLVICNAVLHFAHSLAHFHDMFNELIRVLKSDGILFIRMTSNIGISDQLDSQEPGVYLIPDGSHRFLLTRELIASLMKIHQLHFLEPVKTVNVNDLRCMTTLVLRGA